MKNSDKPKRKLNIKKLIGLIFWIIIILVLAVLSAKKCNYTLKVDALDAANWEQLNNMPIRCVINGTINDSALDADEYSYISNGNSETGGTNAPAFYINDVANGEQYDAIYIRTTNIELRRFIYDSISGDMVDYYARTIWANDYIYENIEPETIFFEGLNNSVMASSRVKYCLYDLGGTEQTGANNNVINSIMLDIINGIFTENTTESALIDYTITTNDNYYYLAIYLLHNNNYLFGVKMNLVGGVNTNETYFHYFNNYLSFYDLYNYNEACYLIVEAGEVDDYLNLYFEIYDDGDNYFYSFEILTDFSFSEQPYTMYTVYNFIDTLPAYIEYINNLKYNEGSVYGYNTGYNLGYTEGTSEGYADGYNDGYDDGTDGTLNTSWITSVMNTATNILNIEILPNIKIIYLVGAFIILGFVRFVIGWIR